MFNPKRISLLIFLLLAAISSYSQFPYHESFKYATASGIKFDPGDNNAYLTADASNPLNATPDAVGDGYLRLTNNLKYQKGYIYNDEILIPSQNGLKIEFEYFTWGGNGADGICFFLYDASVLPHFKIGGFGGSLGYAQYKKDDLPTGPVHAAGVTGGYLGIGIDEFGYFARTFEGRQPLLDGTAVYSEQRGSVAVRGKGSGDALTPNNYPLLAYRRTGLMSPSFSLVGPNTGRFPDSTNTGYRRAHILLERHPVVGFYISVDIVVGGPTRTRHKVIEKFHYAEASPERLGYGISSSTGNNTNFHEIRNLYIDLYDDRPLGLSNVETTKTNEPVSINVLDNDPSKGPGVIIIQNAGNPQPSNGTIEITDENTGIIKYTPNPGFSGTDQFTYKLYDRNKETESFPITVTVHVKPVGSPDIVRTPMNTPVTIDVKNNDVSKVGTTVVPITSTSNGTIIVNPDNQVTYTPTNNYQGADQFTYKLVTADGLESDPITVDIIIAPPNLLPAKIGLAKALTAMDKNIDGSFTLKYRFKLVNIGELTVERLSLQDDLQVTFQDAQVSVKSLTSVDGYLTVNAGYNGISDKELLSSGNLLGPLSAAEIDLELIVSTSRAQVTYNNLAILTGYSTGNGEFLDDLSTDGFSPDPNSPGDFSPNLPTPVTLIKGNIYIPEGFSPNNDGINDYFVIENSEGKPINLEIYNRWGNIVYKSADYQNDWAGKCTEGLCLGEDLPVGTYYYIVKIDNQKKVGFITVNR